MQNMIFVVEVRIAPDAEADDAGWIRIVAHDADREPRCVGHHAHRRAQCRRLPFLRIGLDEPIDRRRRGPHRLVEPAVDVETRRHRTGPNPRRLLRKRRRCHRDPGNEQGDRSPDYLQVTSMPKKCMTDQYPRRRQSHFENDTTMTSGILTRRWHFMKRVLPRTAIGCIVLTVSTSALAPSKPLPPLVGIPAAEIQTVLQHLTYLSIRPDLAGVLPANYVHPALRKVATDGASGTTVDVLRISRRRSTVRKGRA